MKVLVLAILVLNSISSFAAAEDKISGFEKAIICRAVVKDYADILVSASAKTQLAQILDCRSKGIFSVYADGSYGVIVHVESGSLSCRAEIYESSNGAKTPVAFLENCKIFQPKPKMGGSN